MSIVTAVLSVTVIGLIAAIILVAAAKIMYVEEDERIGEVTEILPGANCGACGYAGCADYAKAIVEAGEVANLCTPGGAAVAAEVAKYMGVDAGDVQVKKAVVICQGTHENAKEKFAYEGVQTCEACASLFGGKNMCTYGCLGFGDCVKACIYDAIHIVDGIAVVDQVKCTGCTACATACPKNTIIMQAASPKPVVLCHNHEKGAVARKACTAACIACTRCVKECPVEAIHMDDNLAVIDHEKCIDCGKCVAVCPTKAIQPICLPMVATA